MIMIGYLPIDDVNTTTINKESLLNILRNVCNMSLYIMVIIIDIICYYNFYLECNYYYIINIVGFV